MSQSGLCDLSLAGSAVGATAEPYTLFLEGWPLEEEHLTFITADIPCDLLSDWSSSLPLTKRDGPLAGNCHRSQSPVTFPSSESMTLSLLKVENQEACPVL